MSTYNPKNHILMINGKRITGFAGKIKIKYDDDRVKEENHGDTTTHVINPSEAGTLEFELTHNSQSNSYLNSLNTAMRLVKAPRIGGSFEAPDSDEKTLFSGGVVKTAPESNTIQQVMHLVLKLGCYILSVFHQHTVAVQI